MIVQIKQAIIILLNDKTLHSVVVFEKPYRTRIKVTRKKIDGSLLISFGRPNFAERKFLKDCKKAKCEPRKFWLKQYPKKRKSK